MFNQMRLGEMMTILFSLHGCFVTHTEIIAILVVWVGLFLLQCTVHGVISQAESNMNDLISEYQQYQEATIDDDEYDGEGDDLEQDEA